MLIVILNAGWSEEIMLVSDVVYGAADDETDCIEN
jgi:hypothetical protein